MSAVKGVAFALDVPLLSVPTLPALAASLPADVSGDRVMAVVGSRKGEYFYALYRRDDLAAFSWHDEVSVAGWKMLPWLFRIVPGRWWRLAGIWSHFGLCLMQVGWRGKCRFFFGCFVV